VGGGRGGDGRGMAGGAGCLSVGEAGGPSAEEPGRAARGGAAPAADAYPERHTSSGRPDSGGRPSAAIAALRQGDQELSAWAVPLLPNGGSAADEQRLGAPVRQPSLPRAAGQRAPGRAPPTRPHWFRARP